MIQTIKKEEVDLTRKKDGGNCCSHLPLSSLPAKKSLPPIFNILSAKAHNFEASLLFL
uniref:Uncharacterized protein n=1 Tax=Rhizophora mucronata TaxID=61149 RepID=A0A2P2R2X3_RHIMU